MDILADEPKQCRTCGEWLPATTEYFARDKKGRAGLHYRCKSCSQKASRKYKAENREKILKGKKRYRQENLEKVFASQKRWRDKNKDKEARTNKIYRQNHPEFIKEIRRRYTLEKPEMAIIRQHKRRSKMAGAAGYFTKEDLASLYDLQQGRCCWCAQRIINRLTNNGLPRKEKFSIDHLNPISRGGSNWWWNIILTCDKCNISKHKRRIFSEWSPPAMLTWMEEYIVLATALEVQWVLCLWKLRIGAGG